MRDTPPTSFASFRKSFSRIAYGWKAHRTHCDGCGRPIQAKRDALDLHIESVMSAIDEMERVVVRIMAANRRMHVIFSEIDARVIIVRRRHFWLEVLAFDRLRSWLRAPPRTMVLTVTPHEEDDDGDIVDDDTLVAGARLRRGADPLSIPWMHQIVRGPPLRREIVDTEAGASERE